MEAAESPPFEYVADRRRLAEEVLGKKLPEEVLTFDPLGHRILCAKITEEQDRMTSGGIYIPDNAMEQGGIAVVIGVGVNVGRDIPYPGGDFPEPYYSEPWKLISERIMHKEYTETVVKVDAADRTFESDYYMIPDNAVMAIL